MVRISQPVIDDEEISAVVEVLRSGNLSQGKVVYEFEQAFCKRFDFKYARAASNGTTALHAALLAAGIKPGDKVITTPFTFVATVNAIIHCGAIPCFADISPDSFNISPKSILQALEKWPDAKGLLIVHLFGEACDLDEIVRIAKANHLLLIEDCAQALGTKYKGKHVGTFGHAGAFSFYPTKNFTTGEGGMVTTDEFQFAEKVKLITNHGEYPERYYYILAGYNYRMTNIAAAIGLEQLKKIDNLVKRRQENALYYLEHIHNELITLPKIREISECSFNQFTIKTTKRKQLVDYFKHHGVETGIYYPLTINKQKHVIEYLDYKKVENEPCVYAEEAAEQVVSIPVHPSVTDAEREKIVHLLNSFH